MAPPQVPFGIPMRKEHFAFSPDYIPLNHGSYGAHPISVRDEHLAVRATAEEAPDPFIALNFSARLAKQRELTASLLHSPGGADEIVFVPNASTGTDTILKNLRWEAGRDVILCYDFVYPAVMSGIAWVAERYGVGVEVVPVALPLSDDAFVEQMVSAARAVNNTKGENGQNKRVRLAIIDTIASLPGVRVPFERLVPALQAEGALVHVDGAHGIGHLNIDLATLKPDFFVTNLHKWLFVPRGLAAFYVPKRHQHLIRTTLPTSFGFRPLDPSTESGQAGAEAQDEPGRFISMFDFTGTNDVTNWLCVEAGVKFCEEVCGGQSNIQEYSRSIAQRGAAIAAEALGTDIMDSPGSCLRDCNFANVRLPLDIKSIQSPESITPWMKITGFREGGTYLQTILYRGQLWWRVSGIIYVEEADFHKGAQVLKGLCERVNKGEHVQKS